jgi:hypothetical protein
MSIPTIDSRRFTVGRYEVIAKPIPGSAHMLRYTVFLQGVRVGALASFPTESDCRFLESPPVVPPLKFYQYSSRPGRPKKGTQRPTSPMDNGSPSSREPLPEMLSLPGIPKHDY